METRLMAIKFSDITGGGTPYGATESRPASPAIGKTYFNGTLGYLEIYTSAGWIPATGANDFSLNVTGVNTVVTFTQSYSSGSYSIVSFLNDATVDIYAYASDGSLAGYSNTKAFTASQRFNKMVVIGGSAGDVLQFSFKTTYPTTAATAEFTAGPYITSLTPATLANINTTTTVTGGNFATNIQAVFIGTDSVERAAKTIVRNSATSLTLTRPDLLPQAYEPYSVKVTNPGVTSPTGSNLHILSNSIDAGSSPTWTTSGALTPFIKGSAYTYNLSASDADSTITYAVASGALPTGISLNTSTGVISGTPTVNNVTPYSFVVSATDSGGNTTNSSSLTLSQVVPDSPTSIAAVMAGAQVSVSFTAPVYVGSSSITSYTVVESGSGATTSASSSPITITSPSSGSRTYSVYATNSSGNSLSASATPLYVPSYATFNATGSTQTWTAPAGVTSATFYIYGAGGGNGSGAGVGATGGTTTGTFTITPSQVYTVYVGRTGGQTAGGWPGGGNGGSYNGNGGGGGGYSGIKNAGGTYLAIAGAGGGGGVTASNAGRGGGTSGESVTNGYGTNGGGTQSAGGSAGITIDTPSGAGSSLAGGSASNSGQGGWHGGGGGGAGYYGGASGESGGGAESGGAGGSGYVNSSFSSNGTTIVGVVTDVFRGTAGNSNTDGKVVIAY